MAEQQARPEVTERRCNWPYGLWAQGQGVGGGRRRVGPGKSPDWSEQKIELFGDGLIEQTPHCTDAFTPVSISHFTPGLLADRMRSAASPHPQIRNQQPVKPQPVKRGYSVLSVATVSPPAPSPLSTIPLLSPAPPTHTHVAPSPATAWCYYR